MLKSRTIILAEHTARMELRKVCSKFRLGNLKGRGQSEDQGVDGRIMLEYILLN